jgi:hypothetical protein
MPNYSLIESALKVPDGIACRYFLVDPQQTDRNIILVAAFEGTYPDGSGGNAHGTFISSAALHGVHGFNADCLILDFRRLSYRWGNRLLAVFRDVARFKDAGCEPDEPPFPMVVVTSDRCKDAFLSLVTPVGQPTPEWHFEDMDAAIEYGIKKAEEWLAF